MKHFIDEQGIFEIKVPATWKYSIKNENVHTFQEYEIWKSDAFQLSIFSLDTEKKRNDYQMLRELLPVEKNGQLDFYRYPDKVEDDFTIKTWLMLFVDKSVVFTLTHPNNPDKELDNRTVEDKVNIVRSILKEFKLIEKEKSNAAINSYRFDMFLQGVGATGLILSKAIKNKAFIEATCIIANQIDGLLRIGIVLKNQLVNCNREIASEWIYQGVKDKKKSEKDIYKKSLTLGIIDQIIFNELYSLYEDRNRVIHRFIISEITIAEVEEIAYNYYKKQKAINKIIFDIESEQINKGIGMVTMGDYEQTMQTNLDYIKGKIGKEDYFEDKD
jgi:hypothetical protein